MTLYSTLDYAKQELKAAQPTTTVLSKDDMRLLRHIREVSLRLDSEFPTVPRWPYFAPWVGTHTYLVTRQQVNSRLNTFQFRDNLLELTGDVTLGTQTLVDGTNVSLWPTTNQPPFHALRMIGCCGSWFDNCGSCNTPLQVSIPGIWGFTRDWANAWPQITTLNGALTDSDTAVTFADASAPDPYGMTPGLSAGTLISFDDDSGEYAEITRVDPVSSVGVLLRGVNGTTAAAHGDGVGVLAYQVEPPVLNAVARQAGLMYARQGAYVTVEVQGMSEIRYPADWMAEVRAMTQGYSNGY